MEVMTYRQRHPSCRYCEYNKTIREIGNVPECFALRILCYEPEKRAKKCDLYEASQYIGV